MEKPLSHLFLRAALTLTFLSVNVAPQSADATVATVYRMINTSYDEFLDSLNAPGLPASHADAKSDSEGRLLRAFEIQSKTVVGPLIKMTIHPRASGLPDSLTRYADVRLQFERKSASAQESVYDVLFILTEKTTLSGKMRVRPAGPRCEVKLDIEHSDLSPVILRRGLDLVKKMGFANDRPEAKH